MTVRHDNLEVSWLGYATARLETESGYVAYVDPGRYGVLTGEWTPPADPDSVAGGDRDGDGGKRTGERDRLPHPDPVDYYARDADLVCVTHDHHYDSDAIRRVASEDATVVVYEAVDASRIERSGEPDVDPVEDLPYEVVRVDDETHLSLGGDDGPAVELWTVAAYNDPDGPHLRPDGSPYHPEGFGCGIVLSLDGTTVFWPGDSDALPAFERIEASLFLANISGGPAMDRHEAADLAEAIDPDLVVPIHYNTISLLRTDSAAFAADVAGRSIPVALDER
jgi:L-ascorbate metabolism protein UlaG (beta-lactamase superfamily)